MKKFILLFLVAIISFSLYACKEKITIGEEVTHETNTEENLTMEIIELIGKTSAKVEVTNNTEEEFFSGNAYDFAIEVKKDDKWFFIEIEPRANTSEAWIFEANGTRELTISWNSIYGALPDGDYRIVKVFSPSESRGNLQYVYLSSEFTVE